MFAACPGPKNRSNRAGALPFSIIAGYKQADWGDFPGYASADARPHRILRFAARSVSEEPAPPQALPRLRCGLRLAL